MAAARDAEAGRSGHLLLRYEAFQRDGTLRTKTQRVFCVVDAQELWCVKAEALEKQMALGSLQDRARQLPAILRMRLEECVRVEAVAHTIEESVEKMRLRKRANKPLAFRLSRFLRTETPSGRAKFPPPSFTERPGEETVEFGADAGGNARPWVQFLQTAIWACGAPLPASLCDDASRAASEDDDDDGVGAHAGKTALRILFMKDLKLATRHTALVVHADLDMSSGDDLAEFLLFKLGISPACTRFVARETNESARTELSRTQMREPLANWVHARGQTKARFEIEAWDASGSLSAEAGFTRSSEMLRERPS